MKLATFIRHFTQRDLPPPSPDLVEATEKATRCITEAERVRRQADYELREIIRRSHDRR